MINPTEATALNVFSVIISIVSVSSKVTLRCVLCFFFISALDGLRGFPERCFCAATNHAPPLLLSCVQGLMISYSIDRPTFVFNLLCIGAFVCTCAIFLWFEREASSHKTDLSSHPLPPSLSRLPSYPLRAVFDVFCVFSTVSWLFYVEPSTERTYSVFFLSDPVELLRCAPRV